MRSRKLCSRACIERLSSSNLVFSRSNCFSSVSARFFETSASNKIRDWPAVTFCPSLTRISLTRPANGALIGLSAPRGCNSPWARTTSSILAKQAKTKAKEALPIIVHARALLQTGAGRRRTSCGSIGRTTRADKLALTGRFRFGVGLFSICYTSC